MFFKDARRISAPLYKIIYAKAVEYSSPVLLAIWFVINNWRAITLPTRHRSKRVIYIFRPTLKADTDVIERDSRIRFIALSARICKTIFVGIFGHDHNFSDFDYYEKLRNARSEQEVIYRFWKKFLLFIKPFGLVDAIFNGNWNYYICVEMNRACVDIGIPYIVLYKESMKSDYGNVRDFEVALQRSKFLGTKALFYSRSARRIFQSVDGITEENSSVIGFPRADKLLTINKSRGYDSTSLVLFLANYYESYLYWWPTEILEKYRVMEKVEKHVISFFDITKRFPEKRFVIKLKSSNRTEYLDSLLTKFDLKVSENTTIICDSKSDEIISETTAVMAFGSTVQLEALALQKIVIEPRILPAKNMHTLLGEFPDVVNYVDTADEIEGILLAPARFRPKESARLSALTHFFGYLDGGNCKRARDAIRESIDFVS